MTKNSSVCSLHFSSGAYQNKLGSNDKGIKLKKNAFPSIFLQKNGEIVVREDLFVFPNDTDNTHVRSSAHFEYNSNIPMKKRKLEDIKNLTDNEIDSMTLDELRSSLKKVVPSMKNAFDTKEKIYQKLYRNEQKIKSAKQKEVEFIDVLKKGKISNTFDPRVEKFASQLKFISEKAYNFVRQQIGENRLPHSRTIRRWMSCNNGTPGITSQNDETLEEEIERDHDAEPMLALIMDEMNISANTRYVPSEDEVLGYVDSVADVNLDIDLENTVDDEGNRIIAKNALFYLVNQLLPQKFTQDLSEC